MSSPLQRLRIISGYQIYLDSSQVLLFLGWCFMYKAEPVGMPWTAGIQHIKHLTFVPTHLQWQEPLSKTKTLWDN